MLENAFDVREYWRFRTRKNRKAFRKKKKVSRADRGEREGKTYFFFPLRATRKNASDNNNHDTPKSESGSPRAAFGYTVCVCAGSLVIIFFSLFSAVKRTSPRRDMRNRRERVEGVLTIYVFRPCTCSGFPRRSPTEVFFTASQRRKKKKTPPKRRCRVMNFEFQIAVHGLWSAKKLSFSSTSTCVRVVPVNFYRICFSEYIFVQRVERSRKVYRSENSRRFIFVKRKSYSKCTVYVFQNPRFVQLLWSIHHKNFDYICYLNHIRNKKSILSVSTQHLYDRTRYNVLYILRLQVN